MTISQSSHLPTPDVREGFKKIAVEAARLGGAVLQEQARRGFNVEHKDAVNLVTDADRHAEETIVEVIRAAYPDHRILAEEGGAHVAGASDYQWVIDPLDGTTNFAHGFPAYCVSIGLEYQGRCILGVVFDPTRGELYLGAEGEGATLNGTPLRVSSTGLLNTALLVTGFAYDIRESSNNNLDHFSRFSLRAQGVRRTGTAALDLCYVAAGRFDGFWELQLAPWDVAAGTLLVREAGGIVTDIAGSHDVIKHGSIVAGNPVMHGWLMERLAAG